MRFRGLAGGTLGFLIALAPGSADCQTPAPPPAEARPTAKFPDAWFYMSDQPQRLALLRRNDGKPAAELRVGSWLAGEPATLESLRGRIVVLDFWGTWCQPCLQALPHTNQLSATYKDKGVEFIAVCDGNKNPQRAPDIVERLKLTCRVVIDQGRATYDAFSGQWFPFYVLVDRHGVIRASGLRPDTLQLAIDALLQEQPPGSVPLAQPVAPPPPQPRAAWFEGSPLQRKEAAELEGKPAAPLTLVASTWKNSEALDLAALKGKVVLLDFWGTWCQPCHEAVPSINRLQQKYGEEGLVVIGVCHSKNAATMPVIADKYGIEFPIAADTAGATFKAYRVNGTPDYFLIDREGNIRFADVANLHVEDAVRFLLAEPASAQ